ncbi:hypothetical protein RB594_005043 [Gaeumannomyces avenae]
MRAAAHCLLRPSAAAQRAVRGLQRLSQHQPQGAARPCPRPTPRFTARRPISSSSRARSEQRQPADDPNWTSAIDNPPELVRSGRRHGPGLIILALIPITALVLGTWQVYRLKWKTDLIAKCEDRLVRPPLPLPPRVDPAAVEDFDYRRVYATGRFRHDLEMLIGPRVKDGEQGFMVVTPFETDLPDGWSQPPPPPVLVNRGWISKTLADQRARRRRGGLVDGTVRVEGLLRKPWKKNMFTPDNRPDKGEFYFPDVEQMASLTGSQPIWIEATMEPGLLEVLDMQSRGIPIGRAPEVNLRNNHAQYIFTWYGLAAATSVMFWMVVKKPPSDVARRVRMNKGW